MDRRVTVAAFLGFLIVLMPSLTGEGLGAPTNRPDVWIVPILEWLVDRRHPGLDVRDVGHLVERRVATTADARR